MMSGELARAQPEQYEIVKPETIINISFDQGMDKPSVESASASLSNS